MRHCNFSDELVVRPYQSGVQLIKPESNNNGVLQPVKNYFKLRINVFFTLSDSTMSNFNVEQAANLNAGSKKDLLCKSLITVIGRHAASHIIENNNQVIREKKLKIIEEDVILHNESTFKALSIKLPWYDENNQVIGVFGFAMQLNKHPIAESLTKIAELGFLNFSKSPFSGLVTHQDISLTQREKSILELTIKGHTAKQIARILNLSSRTVEYHLVNIKSKFKVKYRSELIELFH